MYRVMLTLRRSRRSFSSACSSGVGAGGNCGGESGAEIRGESGAEIRGESGAEIRGEGGAESGAENDTGEGDGQRVVGPIGARPPGAGPTSAVLTGTGSRPTEAARAAKGAEPASYPCCHARARSAREYVPIPSPVVCAGLRRTANQTTTPPTRRPNINAMKIPTSTAYGAIAGRTRLSTGGRPFGEIHSEGDGPL